MSDLKKLASGVGNKLYCGELKKTQAFAWVLIRFRPLHSAKGMLNRSIDGIEFQRFASGVGQIMPFSGGNDDGIIGIDFPRKSQVLRTVSDLYQPDALFNADELVRVLMSFQTDAFAGVEAHQGELEVPPRPEGEAEICVLFCDLLNVHNKCVRTVID